MEQLPLAQIRTPPLDGISVSDLMARRLGFGRQKLTAFGV